MDPALCRFLDERARQQAEGPAPTTDLERAFQNRAQLREALALRSEIPGLPNNVAMEPLQIGPRLTGRLFVPLARQQPAAVVVYLHGGGWVCGSTETHDPFCRLLAEAAAVSVVAVDYRLAPEHAHPAALEDAFTTAEWAARHAASWGGDPTTLVIAGDSAGANVAAALLNRLAASGAASSVCAQILLYPVTDHPSARHPSYEETGYGFGAEFMHWVWRQYAPSASPDDPDVSPLRRSPMPRLPATFVATAEHDILRDEGIAYVGKLREAGVTVMHHHSPDMHHNFCVNPATVARFPQCQTTLAALAGWLEQTVREHRSV